MTEVISVDHCLDHVANDVFISRGDSHAKHDCCTIGNVGHCTEVVVKRDEIRHINDSADAQLL